MKMSLILLVVLWSFANVSAQTGASIPAAPAASTATSPASGQTTTAAPPATPNAEAPSPEALARQYIELWNTGDLKQIQAFPPFAMTSVAGRVIVQPAVLMSVITHWRKSMPDLRFEIKDTIVQGDKVAMRTTFRGTYKAQLFPFTAEPKPNEPPRNVRADDLLMFQVKDGRIIEIWEEYNVARVQIQMGGKWCTDVMSSAAPPLDTAASAQADPEPNAAPPTSPKPSDPVER